MDLTDLEGLTILSNPEKPVIDIVFVHELQGHPQKTWSTEKDKERTSSLRKLFAKKKSVEAMQKCSTEDTVEDLFWPKDLLAKDFKEARIMTFGYNSRVTQGFRAANQMTLFAHAKNLLYSLVESRKQKAENDDFVMIHRDLVFIAHSLGGILVKEVIRRSEGDTDSDIQTIWGSTTGILFYGTPHRGSQEWASFGEGVASIASLLAVDVNRKLLHALLPTGPELELTRESFTKLWKRRRDKLTVRTYQESEGMTGFRISGFNKLVVPPDSSDLDDLEQRARAIKGNHRTMVKFDGRKDKRYNMVEHEIDVLISKAKRAETALERVGSHRVEQTYWKSLILAYAGPPDSNLPGKAIEPVEGSLDWLIKSPEYETWTSSVKCSFLWMYGPPGTGKTVAVSHVLNNLRQKKEGRSNCQIASVFCKGHLAFEGQLLGSLLHQLIPRIHENAETPEKLALDNLEIQEGRDPFWQILEALIISFPRRETVFIIDGIDEIESDHRQSFLQSLISFTKIVQETTILRIFISSRDFPDIRELLSNYPSIEKDKEMKECIQSLRFEEWNARESKVESVATGGDWLFSNENESYRKWSENRQSDLLWIEGKPGSGKSTLTKRIVKRLRDEASYEADRPAWKLSGTAAIDSIHAEYYHHSHSQDSRVIIAAFYYSFRGGVTEISHELMLRSLVYQIWNANSRLFPLIRDVYRALKKATGDWTYENLAAVLQSLHQVEFDLKIVIVVDGMDESDNERRKNVLELLSNLSKTQSRCLMKILIASRPENDIRPWMRSARRIVLEKENEEDIKSVVEKGIYRLKDSMEMYLEPGPLESYANQNVLSGVGEYIVKHSRGVFLWVTLVLREIETWITNGAYTKADIDALLRNIPKDLTGKDGLYKNMIDRMISRHSNNTILQHRARRIFAWVAFSNRPLLQEEVRDALAIPSEIKEEMNLKKFKINDHRPSELEKGLYTLCGGFVEVASSTGIVQLIHQTAREFLLDRENLAQPYSIDSLTGDMEIAITSCRYICVTFGAKSLRTQTEATFEDAKTVTKHLSSHKLILYAMTYFMEHLQDLAETSAKICREFEDFVKNVGKKPTLYSSLLLSMWVDKLNWPSSLCIVTDDSLARECMKSVLINASEKGDIFVVKLLLLLGADPQEALLVATKAAHGEVIDALMDNGADVLVSGSDGDAALHIALRSDDYTIVDRLRRHGPDPNAPGALGCIPLQIAAERGNLYSVDELWDMGVDVNIHGINEDTALHTAIRFGHEAVVSKLLQLRANPNAHGASGATPLQVAAELDNIHAVQSLLDMNADVHEYGMKEETALHTAIRFRREEIVEQMLEHIHMANLKDSTFGDSLYETAVESGNERIIQCLHEAFTNKR